MEERRRVGGCAATHNLAGSRRKKTGVLLKTQSMFCVAHCQHGSVDDDAADTWALTPSSVLNLMLKPRGSERRVSDVRRARQPL
jgi:hypothetical protein